MRLARNGRGAYCVLIAKSCTSCGRLKMASEYRVSRAQCKACDAEVARVYRKNNPVTKEQKSFQHRYTLYRLRPSDIEKMFESQNNKCFRCKKPFDFTKTKEIHIDHDHTCCPGPKSCGKCVRGIVCKACNISDGMFEGDLVRIRNFYESYLERSNASE
jgi:hypothetical protein